MLAFIDESGKPNPNDSSSRPVVVAVCFDEKDSRRITRRVYAMKRDLLDPQQTEAELKGTKRLKEKTYARSLSSRLFAEDFFAALSGWKLTVFAMIMRAPFDPLQKDGLLEVRFRYLLRLIDLLAAERGTHANVMFDGRGDEFRDLSRRFSAYLFRSNEGKDLLNIADTPAFVDSATSPGIQIADMCAYAIRVYQEKQLFAGPPSKDSNYQRAVRSWYRYIERTTRDFSVGNSSESRYGFHFLSQRRALTDEQAPIDVAPPCPGQFAGFLLCQRL